MAAGRHRPLPTPQKAFEGIPLALDNAQRHLETADRLAAAGEYGFAVSHLVYAIEESEKARTLGHIWLDEGALSEAEARARLLGHSGRHSSTLAKSWTSGVVWTASAEALRERAGLRPQRSPEEQWAAAMAQHPEALPREWPDIADRVRQAGLHVDLGDDGVWRTPGDQTVADYERLRPAAGHLIAYTRAAFERHKA